MADWVGICGMSFAPLVAAMKAELLAQPVIRADETPIVQLDPDSGRAPPDSINAWTSSGYKVTGS